MSSSYDRYLKFIAIAYLSLFLIVSFLVLSAFEPPFSVTSLNQALGPIINPSVLPASCFLSALVCILIPFMKISQTWKKQIYLFCTNPIIIYLIPLGYYVIQNHDNPFIFLICTFFELSFFIISRAVWRD